LDEDECKRKKSINVLHEKEILSRMKERKEIFHFGKGIKVRITAV